MLDIVYGKKTNPQAVEAVVDLLREQDWEGTLYVGYPVFGSEDASAVTDALLTSIETGAVIFDLSSQEFFNLPPGDMEAAIKARQRELLRKLNSRLVAYEELLEEDGIRLAFPIQVITFLPYEVQNVNVPRLVTRDNLLAELANFAPLERHFFKPLNAAIQKTAALKPKKKRLNVRKEDSMGAVIKFLESQIANLDRWQKNAAIESPEGPQRIRGLAGSGKTIILALKAAYLHANDPEAEIVVTFNTRSLYQQFKSLIRRFYFDQVFDEPNWEKLKILHAWGGELDAGVYSTIAALAGAAPMPFGVARHKYGYPNAFSGACAELVAHLARTSFEPVFDYMLIDEAQDFPAPFFQLAYAATKAPKRIVWAYDELQTLNDTSMPTLDQLFGVDQEGNPLIEINNVEGQPQQDILLPICYRNPPWLLSLALGLGLGTKRGGQFVQMFREPDFWKEIGYEPIQGQLALGAPVRLKREEDRSAPFFNECLTPADSVTWHVFPDDVTQAAWVAADIKRVLTIQELDPNDILVVIPDSVNAPKIALKLSSELKKFEIKSHLIGVTGSLDIVFIDNSVAMSGIYRAKGNEAPLVYVINTEFCQGGYELSRKRNMLFTALTRAKAWVRVCGVGQEMQLIADEMRGIAADNFDLTFVYPTEQQIERLKTAYRERTSREKQAVKKEIKSAERLLQRILNGEVALEELPPGLAEMLRKGVK
ncbi:Superfamily I DNA and RNA helicases [Nitrosospira multiformis]|uniref:Superfamily I DNA and RNA helicases n=1 Tax=Nitrosospira multiformis TaxID=1231 RepID=A0A1H9YE38_9PROT|nr:ATP-binding domain-containing protein [Nitrosospira multiformis]SES67250.1 Superfamily I DNA and RNA helicases [Nitrosospira multiformis]